MVIWQLLSQVEVITIRILHQIGMIFRQETWNLYVLTTQSHYKICRVIMNFAANVQPLHIVFHLFVTLTNKWRFKMV